MNFNAPTALAAFLLTVPAGYAQGTQDQGTAETETKPETSAPEQVDAEQGKDAKPKPEITFDDLWGSPSEGGAPSAEEEIAELFAKVERRLRLTDRVLLDASAGDASRLDEIEGSGIEDLLRDLPKSESPKGSKSTSDECQGVSGSLEQSSSQVRKALSEIDEIIQIAQSMPPNCQSGPPGGEKKSQGQSPLDDRPQQSREKSQSPEKPQESPQEGGQKPQQKGQDPKDNKSSDEDPRNERADSTPGSETGAVPPTVDQREEWGDLPVHVRDVFRAEGGPGLPAQYRDWIDAYYRRLNERSSD